MPLIVERHAILLPSHQCVATGSIGRIALAWLSSGARSLTRFGIRLFGDAGASAKKIA